MSIVNSTTTVNGASGTLTLQTNGTNAASINSSQVLSTVNDATIHGITVGLGGGAQATSMAVGNAALAATNTGDYNAAIGYQAGNANTSGTLNTFAGAFSGLANTTGSYNTAFGVNSFKVNSTGSNNSAFGFSALLNSTGNGNTGCGYQAGYLITSGSNNTVLGGFSGNQNSLDIRTASNYIVLSDGSGNPRQIIDNNGFVGFGGSPSYQLHVKQAVAGSDVWVTSNNTSATANRAGFISYLNGVAGTPNTLWCTDSTGQAYIVNSSTSPISLQVGSREVFAVTNSGTAPLTLTNYAGTVPTASWQVGPNTATHFVVFNNSSAGVYVINGATAWSGTSDERLKNVTGVYENPLEDISKIQAVKFTWKSDSENKPQVGVIAQSVLDVVPEAVDLSASVPGDDTEYYGVRYTELVPICIAAIQELSAKNDALEARLAALEAK